MLTFLRRHSRFGLRTLLVVLTVLCLTGGWFVNRVRRQRDAVAWAKRYGEVEYDSRAPRREPAWLREWLGIDFFAGPIGVRLRDVPDLTPLGELSSLKDVYIAAPRLKDWRALSQLSQLQELGLNVQEIDEITPLRLPKLKSVTVVCDLDPAEAFAGCPSLLAIYLPRTKVANLEFVRAWPKLRRLSVAGANEDLSPLLACLELEDLFLEGSSVRDLRPLGQLPKLQGMALREWKARDFIPPPPLATLQEFGVSEGPADLGPLLERMPKLTELGLGRRSKEDLSVLQICPQLTRLSLDRLEVRDLSPLTELKAVKELFLRELEIDDLSPLPAMPALTDLWLSGQHLRDVTTLTKLTALGTLRAPQSLNTPAIEQQLRAALPRCSLTFEPVTPPTSEPSE